jgi:hypothetical protein
MAPEKAVDVDALLAESLVADNGGQTCWAVDLEGPALEYVEGLKRLVADGRKPVWKKCAANLQVLGVKRSYGTVQNHVTGRCQCPK